MDHQNKKNIFESWYVLDLPEIKPPMAAHAALIFSFVFLFVVLIYSTFVEQPVTIDVTGQLTLEKPPVPIRSLKSLTVLKNEVTENKTVRAGEVLMTSSLGQSPLYFETIKKLQFKSDALVSTSRLCSQCVTELYDEYEKLIVLGDKNNINPYIVFLKLNQKEIESLALDYTSNVKSMTALYSQMQNKRQVANTGNLNFSKLSQSQLLSTYEKYQVSILNQQKIYEDFRKKLDIENQKNKSVLSEVMNSESVKAPISGKIINVKTKGVGEFISSGQVLFEIVPENNDLVVTFEIQNKDISAIRLNDLIDVAVDTYSEQDFDRFKAQIINIYEPENDIRDYSQQKSTSKSFRVMARIQAQSVPKQMNLINGMALRATIIKKNQTLLMSFLKTIFKLKENGKG